MTLTFAQLRDIGYARSQRYFTGEVDDWMVETWVTAIGGEVGEALNVVKKLVRARDGMAGNLPDADSALTERLAGELADTVIYLGVALTEWKLDGLGALTAHPDFDTLRPWTRLHYADRFGRKPIECWSVRLLPPLGLFADEATQRNWPGVRREGARLLTAIDLLAIDAGIDLGLAVVTTFNRTSARLGFPERLEP